MHPALAASPNSTQPNALTMKETSTMKAKILITIGCLLLMAGFIHAQTPMPSFSLVDSSAPITSGTYHPNDTFTLTLNGTWNYSSNGFSLWLETNTTLAPPISILSQTYVTFPSPQDNSTNKAFNDTAGQTNSGFLTDHDT